VGGQRNSELGRGWWLEEVEPGFSLNVLDLLRTITWKGLESVGKISRTKERGKMNPTDFYNTSPFLFCISQTCCHTLPQAGWLTVTEMFSLTVLETRSLESRCQQDHAPVAGSKGGSFLISSSCWWMLSVLDALWLIVKAL
jgi:hypothetical protein